AFWRDQAMDQILAAQPLKVPVMLVHSLWDQEDIYGAPAVYKAIKPKDTNNDKVFLVMGPWHHGQEIGDGSTLGALKFDTDTGLYFRQNILRPFLDHYLKDDAPKAGVPPVYAFETGTNVWRKLPAWPAGCASGCSIKPTPLYLNAGLKASYAAPKPNDAALDEYVSDPAKPVPFRARPIQPAMGGYQLIVAADIFRGRYRESPETPKPLASDKPLVYRFNLPTANHVFLPGHRIMVQVQSSWFPLYDRNPQTFVPNIFWAKPGDYRKATQRVYHTPSEASFVQLPVVVTR